MFDRFQIGFRGGLLSCLPAALLVCLLSSASAQGLIDLTEVEIEELTEKVESTEEQVEKLSDQEANVEEVRSFLRKLTLTDELLEEIDEKVKCLDSESFAERYVASLYLSKLPVLPRGRMEKLVENGSLEMRIRLEQVFMGNTSDRTDALVVEAMEAVMTGELEGLMPEVLRALEGRDYNDGSRWDACVGACEMTAVPEDIEQLKGALSSETPVVRGGAVVALIKLMGIRAAPVLVPMVKDPNDRIKLICADFLRTRGNRECLRAYAALLSAEEFTVRWRSLDALRQIAEQDFEFYAAAEPDERLEPAKRWVDWVEKNIETAELTFDIVETKEIVLFNGKDLDGWKEVKGFFKAPGDDAAAKHGWGVEDGNLVCFGGQASHLRTIAAYKDYILNLEYKTPEGAGDSGVGLFLQGPDKVSPECLEVQVLSGRTGDLYQIGGFTAKGADGAAISFRSGRIAEPKESEADWNQMEIKVVNGTLEVSINGTVVNKASDCPEGETRMTLRNEGTRVEFRGLILIPLD